MVYRKKLQLIFSVFSDALDQYVAFVSVTVQNPNVQGGDGMDVSGVNQKIFF